MRSPTLGRWILVVLIAGAGILLWTQRDELRELLGLSERTIPEAAATREPLTIQIGGAVSADTETVRGVHRPDGPAWEGIRTALARDDLTVVQFGCAVTGDGGDGDGCDGAVLEALPQVGIEAVALANEGVAARGPEQLGATLRVARASGLSTVGAGPNLGAAWRPLTVERGGWRVAVVAATTSAPSEHAASEERPGIADGRDLVALTDRVRAAKERADAVLVVLRWEMAPDGPDEVQTGAAHSLIDAGADAVIGQTPGVLRRMDRYRGRPIFWSLDDLVRPVEGGREVHTALARLVISQEGAIHGRMVPVVIEPPGRAVVRRR